MLLENSITNLCDFSKKKCTTTHHKAWQAGNISLPCCVHWLIVRLDVDDKQISSYKERKKKSRDIYCRGRKQKSAVECWLLTPVGDLSIFDANFLLSFQHCALRHNTVHACACEPIVFY